LSVAGHWPLASESRILTSHESYAVMAPLSLDSHLIIRPGTRLTPDSSNLRAGTRTWKDNRFPISPVHMHKGCEINSHWRKRYRLSQTWPTSTHLCTVVHRSQNLDSFRPAHRSTTNPSDTPSSVYP